MGIEASAFTRFLQLCFALCAARTKSCAMHVGFREKKQNCLQRGFDPPGSATSRVAVRRANHGVISRENE